MRNSAQVDLEGRQNDNTTETNKLFIWVASYSTWHRTSKSTHRLCVLQRSWLLIFRMGRTTRWPTDIITKFREILCLSHQTFHNTRSAQNKTSHTQGPDQWSGLSDLFLMNKRDFRLKKKKKNTWQMSWVWPSVIISLAWIMSILWL